MAEKHVSLSSEQLSTRLGTFGLGRNITEEEEIGDEEKNSYDAESGEGLDPDADADGDTDDLDADDQYEEDEENEDEDESEDEIAAKPKHKNLSKREKQFLKRAEKSEAIARDMQSKLDANQSQVNNIQREFEKFQKNQHKESEDLDKLLENITESYYEPEAVKDLVKKAYNSAPAPEADPQEVIKDWNKAQDQHLKQNADHSKIQAYIKKHYDKLKSHDLFQGPPMDMTATDRTVRLIMALDEVATLKKRLKKGAMPPMNNKSKRRATPSGPAPGDLGGALENYFERL